MALQQIFTVPVPVDRAWDALLDPRRITPCLPGAGLDSVEGDAFTGNVKIGLGPINLSYQGRQGGGAASGAASATVTAVLTGDGDRTTVATTTDLDVTGRPTQFGPGVMNDVANRIVDQFAGSLAALLTGGDQEAAPPVTRLRRSPRRRRGPRARPPAVPGRR